MLKKFGIFFCQTSITKKLRKTEKCGLNNFNQLINYNCTTTNNENNEEKWLCSYIRQHWLALNDVEYLGIQNILLTRGVSHCGLAIYKIIKYLKAKEEL